MPYSKAHKSRSKDRILKAAGELFARYSSVGHGGGCGDCQKHFR